MTFLKLLTNCLKEARQTKRDLKQIKNIDDSIDAFQRITNTIALGSNDIEVEIHLNNGGTIIIRRQPLNEVGYETFQERVEKARKNRPSIDY